MNDNRKSAAGRNVKVLNDVALETLLNEVISEASSRPSMRDALIRLLGDSLVEVKLEQFGRMPGHRDLFEEATKAMTEPEAVA